MKSHKDRTPVNRFLPALLAPLFVALAMSAVWPFFALNPAAPYLLAVIFVAWYGGLGPGLLAVALSFLLAKFFFVEPYFSFWFFQDDDLIRLLLFTLIGIFISVVCELMHSERRRAEINLDGVRANEQRYRKLAENFPNGAVITYDKDLRVTFIAGKDLEETGFSGELSMGKSIDEIAPPEVAALVKPHFRAAFAGQTEIYECPFPDGRLYVAAVAPLLDGQGQTSEILVITQNVTARKQAEQARRESEERYRELFENARDTMYVHDLSGRYISVNRAAEKLSGYTRAELLGKKYTEFVPSEQIDRFREYLCHKLKNQGETTYESEVITKDGRRVSVEVSSHLIFENGVPVAVQGTARDITERKAADEKLKATSRQLRALSARLQLAREEEDARIAREIHDELGSLLTSLRWDLERASDILAGPLESSEIPPLQEKILALIKLSDVAISAIRRIASELRPSVLDDLGLVAAIEWQAQQFQSRTGIICNCDCLLEEIALTDEQSTALFRIFQEALTNVLRHAQATHVNVEMTNEAGQLTLSINDNGRGINESEKSGHHSLGLLGMRERARLIASEIDISGIAGKGTKVVVRLPLSEASAKLSEDELKVMLTAPVTVLSAGDVTHNEENPHYRRSRNRSRRS